jgi:hypothetical protein
VSISSVSPPAAVAGSPDITITIGGAGFQKPSQGATPNWSFAVWEADGAETDLVTRVDSDSQLTATVPARLLKAPASAQLRVVNGDSMGWSDGYHGYPQSNSLSFAVSSATAR